MHNCNELEEPQGRFSLELSGTTMRREEGSKCSLRDADKKLVVQVLNVGRRGLGSDESRGF